MWGDQSQEQGIVNDGQDAFAAPPRASSPYYLSGLPSDDRGIAHGDVPGRTGNALAVQQPASVGPNREIIMCGLTMPLVQVHRESRGQQVTVLFVPIARPHPLRVYSYVNCVYSVVLPPPPPSLCSLICLFLGLFFRRISSL